MGLTMRSLICASALMLASIVTAQDDGGGSGGGGGGEMKPSKIRENSVIAHATCMGLAFAFLMPMGAILIRIAPMRNLVWYHAAIMLFAYVLALAGLGLGVYIAIEPESQLVADNGHPIIGIIVVGLLLLQPPLGLAHHWLYKKNHTRTIWATLHVWWGRILVTVAIINGGLGLQLSGNTVKGEIAYGVIAGVIWLVWVGVSATSSVTTKGSKGETGDKLIGRHQVESKNDYVEDGTTRGTM